MIPNNIKIGCYDIRVMKMEDKEALAHGIHGHYSSLEHVIRINKTLDNMQLLNTMMHEVMHACYDIGVVTDDDDEERIVTTMANMYSQVIRDNPDYNRFVAKCLKGLN